MRLIDSAPMPPRRRHDYNAILDGSTWELVKGEDYDCLTKSMRSMLYAEAGERRGRAQIIPFHGKNGREGLRVTFIAQEATG